MHIGLIGGIGPAATEFYYRALVKLYANANRRLDLTIVATVDEHHPGQTTWVEAPPRV